MKVTGVEVHHLDRYLLVEVHTDEGITGLGESGAVGFLDASAAAIRTCGEYLVGRDPLRIEHHWQYLYRCRHFTGSVIMGAISALDIALWDIAGQYHGVPVHRLLGGPTRDRARAYHHVMGESREKILTGIQDVCAHGWTAVGHLTPFLDEPREVPMPAQTYAARIGDAADAVRQYRELVGDEVDLCIEIHRRLTPAEAIQLGHAIADYRPLFMEDPIRPDSIDQMAHVAVRTPVPIATGERLTSLWEFDMLLARGGAAYVRPDVCMVGGITGMMKIAALAEARYVDLVPHNPLSPVSTAACLQVAAAIPNVALLEYPGDEHVPPKSEIVDSPARHDGHGHLIVPTTPGIGVTLNRAALQTVPPYHRKTITRLGYDGAVVDQ